MRARTAPPVSSPTSSETLEERVAAAPDRYRWDYIEALVICRKADGSERDRTRPSA